MRNNPLNRNDPTGHFAPLVAAGVGALVGFSIDILVQGVPQLAAGNFLNIQINWAEAAGATTAGAIAGGTMGVGALIIAKTSLEGGLAILASGAAGGIGNIIGNPAGALVESSITTGNPVFSNENFISASQNGVFDLDKVVFDGVTGFASGGISYLSFGKPIIPKTINPQYSLEKGVAYCPVPMVNRLGKPVFKPNFQIPIQKQAISYKTITTASDYIQEAGLKWANRVYENNQRRLKRINEE